MQQIFTPAFKDNLIKAALYSFAILDYEGEDSASLKSIRDSEIFDEIGIEFVNFALKSLQEKRMINWDEEKIGKISLTPKGKEKFFLIRDDFFDDDKISLLKEIIKNEYEEFCKKADHSQNQSTLTQLKLRGRPNEKVPKTGWWYSQALAAQGRCYFNAGDQFPSIETTNWGIVIWNFESN